MGLMSIFRSRKRRNSGGAVTGHASGIPSPFDMHALRLGVQKGCVLPVRCGCCQGEWLDALEPNQESPLRCPHCSATNQVMWQFQLLVVG